MKFMCSLLSSEMGKRKPSCANPFMKERHGKIIGTNKVSAALLIECKASEMVISDDVKAGSKLCIGCLKKLDHHVTDYIARTGRAAFRSKVAMLEGQGDSVTPSASEALQGE